MNDFKCDPPKPNCSGFSKGQCISIENCKRQKLIDKCRWVYLPDDVLIDVDCLKECVLVFEENPWGWNYCPYCGKPIQIESEGGDEYEG